MPAFVMGFVVLALTTPGDAMVVRAPTARRKWGALVEGTLGELAGRQRKQLNNLVQRAGGRDGVISALAAVPAAIKADTEKLLDRLASIFHLSDDEFTVLTVQRQKHYHVIHSKTANTILWAVVLGFVATGRGR